MAQVIFSGGGCDALKLADRSGLSKDLSGRGWWCPLRRVAALLTWMMNLCSTVPGEGTRHEYVTTWGFRGGRLSWTMEWLNGEEWEVGRHVPGTVGWAENVPSCLHSHIFCLTLQMWADRGKDRLYVKESKNNVSWPLAHPMFFWFCVFQRISVSWWQPWAWRRVRIACGATVPTKPSCLCGSFWLQLTPWLSRWGCGCLSRFLASRQLYLLCRDPLSNRKK